MVSVHAPAGREPPPPSNACATRMETTASNTAAAGHAHRRTLPAGAADLFLDSVLTLLSRASALWPRAGCAACRAVCFFFRFLDTAHLTASGNREEVEPDGQDDGSANLFQLCGPLAQGGQVSHQARKGARGHHAGEVHLSRCRPQPPHHTILLQFHATRRSATGPGSVPATRRALPRTRQSGESLPHCRDRCR